MCGVELVDNLSACHVVNVFVRWAQWIVLRGKKWKEKWNRHFRHEFIYIFFASYSDTDR